MKTFARRAVYALAILLAVLFLSSGVGWFWMSETARDLVRRGATPFTTSKIGLKGPGIEFGPNDSLYLEDSGRIWRIWWTIMKGKPAPALPSTWWKVVEFYGEDSQVPLISLYVDPSDVAQLDGSARYVNDPVRKGRVGADKCKGLDVLVARYIRQELEKGATPR